MKIWIFSSIFFSSPFFHPFFFSKGKKTGWKKKEKKNEREIKSFHFFILLRKSLFQKIKDAISIFSKFEKNQIFFTLFVVIFESSWKISLSFFFSKEKKAGKCIHSIFFLSEKKRTAQFFFRRKKNIKKNFNVCDIVMLFVLFLNHIFCALLHEHQLLNILYLLMIF